MNPNSPYDWVVNLSLEAQKIKKRGATTAGIVNRLPLCFAKFLKILEILMILILSFSKFCAWTCGCIMTEEGYGGFSSITRSLVVDLQGHRLTLLTICAGVKGSHALETAHSPASAAAYCDWLITVFSTKSLLLTLGGFSVLIHCDHLMVRHAV